MPATTAAELVARALDRNSKLRFSGSVWRLGRLALTKTDGELTDMGHAFRSRRPDADLSHFDRSTQRITGQQVRVRDLGGRERIVAQMTDGKMIATTLGQSYYRSGSSAFVAYVPAWRRDSSGNFERYSLSLDDLWLRTLPGGPELLAELHSAVYSSDPADVQRRIVDAVAHATRARATHRHLVPRDDHFDEGLAPVEKDLAVFDGYDDDIFIDPEDLKHGAVRMSVFAPGYNSRARSYIQEVKQRPLRGAVLVDDDLYRKTGLVPEAWLDTGKCVLYQMQKVVTFRKKTYGSHDRDEHERFTLDELEAIFDEAWEDQIEKDLDERPGPHPTIYEALLPFADLVGTMDPSDLEKCLRNDNSPCKELRKVVQRFYGWIRGQWDEKVLKVLTILSSKPRQFDDWRQDGVTPELLETVCTKTVNPLWLIKGDHVLYKFIPPGWEDLTEDQRRYHKPIVMSVNAGHAFFYKCPDARKSIQHMRIDFEPAFEQHAKLTLHNVRDDRLPFGDMEPFSSEALDEAIEARRSACFHHSDLASLVEWFRTERQTVSFRAVGDMQLTKWIYINGLGKGVSIRIKRVSKDAPLLHRAAQHLCRQFFDVPYYGEGLPTLVNRCVEAILTKPRRYLSREQERLCRDAYNNACVDCGSKERLEFDHEIPLCQGGSNDFSNFRPRCHECHVRKTQESDLARPHLLQSEFSVNMREIFRSTPKPQQQSGSNWQEVLDANELPEPHPEKRFDVIDVVGCRRNALLQRRPRRLIGGKTVPRGLPVFAPSDEPEAVGLTDWQDCDFVWVEIPDIDPHDPAVWERVRPYNGAHYYPVETAEDLVNWGIINVKTITKGIRASRHFDPQDLSLAWNKVIEALAHVEPERRREFEKSVYVQHIGFMGITSNSTTTVLNTTIPEDVPAEDVVFHHFEGSMTIGYETHLLDNRSWYPLNLIALYGEQVAMCRAWRMIRACEASIHRPLALAWHIDGIALASVPATLKKRVREVKYPDGTFMYAIKNDHKTSYNVLPKHTERLLETGNRIAPSPQPRRSVDEHDLEAELAGRVNDPDWFDKLARLLFDNGGGMVLGPGGVGKTRGLLKSFKKLTESSGQVTHTVALTHVAARLARGQTLERFLLRAPVRQTNSTWIVVDECSQIPQCRWAELQRFKLIGVKFLILGDFAGQLRPPSDLWSDARRRYEDCDDIWTLSEGLQVRLSEYRRGMNPGYFRYYCSLYADVAEDDAAKDHTERTKLAAHIRHTREILPWDGDHRALHVVMSNDKRRLINRHCNERSHRERPEAVFVESPDADKPLIGEPSFWCYTGQQLQARVTNNQLGVFKNVLYHVQCVSKLECVLQMSAEYADDPENISLPLPDLGKYFRMAYAVVYMNVQGRTISEGSVVLWDTLRGKHVHRHMTLRHFIMGLQRVQDPRQLKIASFQQETDFLGVELPEPERPVYEDEDEEEEEEDEPEQPAKRPRRA